MYAQCSSEPNTLTIVTAKRTILRPPIRQGHAESTFQPPLQWRALALATIVLNNYHCSQHSGGADLGPNANRSDRLPPGTV